MLKGCRAHELGGKLELKRIRTGWRMLRSSEFKTSADVEDLTCCERNKGPWDEDTEKDMNSRG